MNQQLAFEFIRTVAPKRRAFYQFSWLRKVGRGFAGQSWGLGHLGEDAFAAYENWLEFFTPLSSNGGAA